MNLDRSNYFTSNIIFKEKIIIIFVIVYEKLLISVNEYQFSNSSVKANLKLIIGKIILMQIRQLCFTSHLL